jgi:hypothetical protein
MSCVSDRRTSVIRSPIPELVPVMSTAGRGSWLSAATVKAAIKQTKEAGANNRRVTQDAMWCSFIGLSRPVVYG